MLGGLLLERPDKTRNLPRYGHLTLSRALLDRMLCPRRLRANAEHRGLHLNPEKRLKRLRRRGGDVGATEGATWGVRGIMKRFRAPANSVEQQ